MLRTLTLENYRGFRRFELHDLGRVNLLVGTNNSGKTSILEAISLLCTAGVSKLWLGFLSRGETLYETWQEHESSFDIRHLFHGRELRVGARFSLSATGDGLRTSVSGLITDPRPAPVGQPSWPEERVNEIPEIEPEWLADLELRWEQPKSLNTVVYRVDRDGGVRPSPLGPPLRRPRNQIRTQFVPVGMLSPSTVIDMFESVVLTPDEQVVTRALNIIDPSIERIATSASKRWRQEGGGPTTKAGLVVRSHDKADRIPIGSMGDGIWRILGLALTLVHCRDGVLLIDEIDTGLHYSVMEKMWKLVTETARRLNVQVFATTHSRDCYESLAAVCREGVMEGSEVTIQRIEPKKDRSVAYTEAEIIAAARRDTEVR